VAGNVSGVSVAITATGAVLVWSGWSNTSLAATFKSILSGKLPAPGTGGAPPPTAAGTGAAGTSAAGLDSSASGNYLTIARYLVSNGYSNAGAAGVVGCIAGESGGSPEAEASPGNPSGGAGLIQWTGSSYSEFPAQVTGNATADLEQQLPLIIAYNNAQGSGLVAMLNAQADPVSAADFYSQHFERPAVTDSDVRAGVATSVYSQLQAGKS
jgi:hypothetical protein